MIKYIYNMDIITRNNLIYNSLQKVKIITPEGEIKELDKKECDLR